MSTSVGFQGGNFDKKLDRATSHKAGRKTNVQTEATPRWSTATLILTTSVISIAVTSTLFAVLFFFFLSKNETLNVADAANAAPAPAKNLDLRPVEKALLPNQLVQAPQPERKLSADIPQKPAVHLNAAESKKSSTVVSQTAVYNPELEIVKFKAEREDRRREEERLAKEQEAQQKAKEERARDLASLKAGFERQLKDADLKKINLPLQIKKAEKELADLKKRLSRQKNQRVPIHHIRTTEENIKSTEDSILLMERQLKGAEHTSEQMKASLERLNSSAVTTTSVPKG